MNDECKSERPPEPTENEPRSSTRAREINIKSLDHGYIVRVGCQEFAIESKFNLLSQLADYINNPSATEEKYFKGKLF